MIQKWWTILYYLRFDLLLSYLRTLSSFPRSPTTWEREHRQLRIQIERYKRPSSERQSVFLERRKSTFWLFTTKLMKGKRSSLLCDILIKTMMSRLLDEWHHWKFLPLFLEKLLHILKSFNILWKNTRRILKLNLRLCQFKILNLQIHEINKKRCSLRKMDLSF